MEDAGAIAYGGEDERERRDEHASVHGQGTGCSKRLTLFVTIFRSGISKHF